MKTTERLRLLRDVLQDESYRSARSEMRTRVLAEARRQRARRGWARRALAMAACVPLAVGFYLTVMRQVPSSTPGSSALTVIRSRPMAAEEIVRTAHTPGAGPARGALTIVKTMGAEVAIVQTTQATEELSDQQLLDLFKGRPVALVTINAHERQLIVLENEQNPSP